MLETELGFDETLLLNILNVAELLFLSDCFIQEVLWNIYTNQYFLLNSFSFLVFDWDVKYVGVFLKIELLQLGQYDVFFTGVSICLRSGDDIITFTLFL